jgi:hypothetical protein
MLSIDAPEVHYPGTKPPSTQDKSLSQLAEWIQEGKAPIEDGLGKYLYPKLATESLALYRRIKANSQRVSSRNC